MGKNGKTTSDNNTVVENSSSRARNLNNFSGEEARLQKVNIGDPTEAIPLAAELCQRETSSSSNSSCWKIFLPFGFKHLQTPRYFITRVNPGLGKPRSLCCFL